MTITRLRPFFTFTEERLAEVRAVVPEAFADGRVNWEVLKEALGEWTEPEDVDAEHFGLFWPGKREARRLAAKPSRGTLVPVPGEGVNEETTRNLFIEGDNLEVLKLLQKSYAGRVKMIYIDPPYNTGNDFVYNDDFRDSLGDYLRRTGQVDEEGKAVSSNTRADGRFHANWLSMMYPRLALARNLLRDDGVLFVSISDAEGAHLQMLLNELFGEENSLGRFVWTYPLSENAGVISRSHEYVLVMARNSETFDRFRLTADELGRLGAEVSDACFRAVQPKNPMTEMSIPVGTRIESNVDVDWQAGWMTFGKARCELLDDAQFREGRLVRSVRIRAAWTMKAQCEAYFRACEEGREPKVVDSKGQRVIEIFFTRSGRLSYRKERSATSKVRSHIAGEQLTYTAGRVELENLFDGTAPFPYPKPTALLLKLIELSTEEGDIVLDFFAGSGTTGHAVLKLAASAAGNRTFVCVQLPELSRHDSPFPTVAAIGRERLSRACRSLQTSAPHVPLGFRSFQLQPSHFLAWEDYDGDNVEQLEALFEEAATPLVKGWTPDTLLTEVLLLQGFPLDARIEAQSALKKNDVRLVTSDHVGHRLWVCLDRNIDDATIAALAPAADDVVVCLDAALGDEAKLRLADRCTLETI